MGGGPGIDHGREQMGHQEEKGDKTASKFEKECAEKAPFLKFVPFLFTSALTGQRVTKVLDVISEVDEERRKRITTSQVNDALQELLARRQPPQAAGHEIKLNYATQVETNPPAIAVFGKQSELLQEHYVRYLHNGFRDFWGFKGNPLRSCFAASRARPRTELTLMHPAYGLLIAYAAGSFPSAYIAGRLVKGIDLRTVGSGNLGATNVYRTLGFGAALAVLVIDLAKGALPVMYLPRAARRGSRGKRRHTLVGAGIWRRGDCRAREAGLPALEGRRQGRRDRRPACFLVLAPEPLLATVIVCIAVVWYTGFMSAGSITAAALFPLLVWLDARVTPVLWGALLVAAIIAGRIARHGASAEGTDAPLPEKDRGS